MEVANQIISNLPIVDEVDKVEIVSPGFINFYLAQDYTFSLVKKLIKNKNFLVSKINEISQKDYPSDVLIEHTHVNPSKSVHIGHLRNTCIGDSVHKFLNFLDIPNKTVYYQNDIGMQVSALVLAAKKGLNSPENYQNLLRWADDTYSQISKMIEDNPELEEERKQVQKQMFLFDNDDWNLANDYSTKILVNILEYLKDIDVTFDFIIKESDVQRSELWEKSFELLKSKKNFYLSKSGEKEGCYLLAMPDKDDKIVVRSNGVATYVANDIALHLWKFGIMKDFDYTELNSPEFKAIPISTQTKTIEYQKPTTKTVINVIGNEQSYPQEVIKEAFEVLGYSDLAENFIHLNYGFVYLSIDSCKLLGLPYDKSDKRVKISGRAGTVLTAKDFIKILEQHLSDNFPESEYIPQIALFTAKYELLKIDTYKDIVFDIHRACDLKGNTGSYILYSFARAKGVLRKNTKNIDDLEFDIEKLNDSAAALLNELSQMSDVLAKFKNTLSPSVVCSYLQNLSMMYNSFYSNNKIIGSSSESNGLIITHLFQEALVILSEILGLKLISKM
jgi:arginyl-tRNA synthetase